MSLAPLETQQQLEVAGDAIAQVAQIVQQRALLALEEIDGAMQEEGPVLPPDFFNKIVRQSMHVDFEQFIEPLPTLPKIPAAAGKQGFPDDGTSVAMIVDKTALLEKVVQLETDSLAVDESLLTEQEKQIALDVAHDEDVSAWVSAISNYFAFKQIECLPFSELVEKVQYSSKCHDNGSSLVKIWLELLLGAFGLEQQEFYNVDSIKVRC